MSIKAIPSPAAPQELARRLPKADVRFGDLGFGAASLGNLYKKISDEAAHATLHRAVTGGITYFDTAPRYGQGLSERRMGESGVLDNMVVSTKVGRVLHPIAPPPPGLERHGFVDGDPFDETFDYSYDGILRAFESSLARLRRDQIDVVYVHDIGALTHGADYERHRKVLLESGTKALAELRSSGRVKAIGLGVNEVEVCHDLIPEMDLDVMMLAGRYTLLEPHAALSLLDICVERMIGVVCAAPYNSGILARAYQENQRELMYNYAPASNEIIHKVRILQEICDAFNVHLPHAALQFPLRSEAVCSVVVGMGSVDSVARNLEGMRVDIPEAFWKALDEVLRPKA